MGRYTDLLYAQPSILEGIGRLLDFAGSLDGYNYAETPAEADRRAMASDYWAVGDDMRTAVNSYAQRNQVRLVDE